MDVGSFLGVPVEQADLREEGILEGEVPEEDRVVSKLEVGVTQSVGELIGLRLQAS